MDVFESSQHDDSLRDYINQHFLTWLSQHSELSRHWEILTQSGDWLDFVNPQKHTEQVADLAFALAQEPSVRQWHGKSINPIDLNQMAQLHDIGKAYRQFMPYFFGNLFEVLLGGNERLKPDDPILDSLHRGISESNRSRFTGALRYLARSLPASSNPHSALHDLTWRQLWDTHSELTHRMLVDAGEPELAHQAAGHHFLSWCQRGEAFIGYCPLTSTDGMILLECADYMAAAMHRPPIKSQAEAAQSLHQLIGRLITKFQATELDLTSWGGHHTLRNQAVLDRLTRYESLAAIILETPQSLPGSRPSASPSRR